MFIISIGIWIGYRVIVRRKQKVTRLREVAINLFFIYFLAVIYFTLFKNGELAISFNNYRYLNLVPLIETIKMFSDNFMGLSNSLYNVVGNILLFVPLGLFTPLLFKKADDFKKILLYGFIGSVSIEVIQYFTAINITDIDDVIFNTFGTVIGLLCYRIFKCIIERVNLKKLLNLVQNKEQDKILSLAIKPIGIMLCCGIIITYGIAYISTYSSKLSDEEMAVAAFSRYSDGEFVAFKDFDKYKFSLKDEGDYIEIGRLQRVLNNRYTAGWNTQLHWRNMRFGYGVDIINNYDTNEASVVVFGKNNTSKALIINFNGELYTEELLPNEYFIIIDPEYKKLSEDTDIYNIFNQQDCKDLKIEFQDKNGEMDSNMKFIK